MISFRKSLAFRLLLLSFFLLALPLLVDAFVIIQKSYRDAIQDTKAYLVELGKDRELPLSQMLPLKRPLLTVFGNFLDLETNFPKEPDEKLNEKLAELARIGDFLAISLMQFKEGGTIEVVASNIPEEVGQDLTNLFRLINIFSPEIYERGFFTFLSYNQITLEPEYDVGRVVYDADRKPLGIITVSKRIAQQLERLLIPDTDTYPVYFGLLDPFSIVFASSDPSLRFQYFSPISVRTQELLHNLKFFSYPNLAPTPLPVSYKIGFPFFEFSWSHSDQIAHLHRLAHSDYSVLAYAPRDRVFIKPLVDFIHIYGMYLVILAVCGVLAYLLVYRMARPMRSLSLVMNSIQEGDLKKRYQSDKWGFEINQLGHIFNETIETLVRKKQQVEQQRIVKEAFEKELLIGQQVQRRLFPEKMPAYPGVELAEFYTPAKEVGGDFYDVFVRESRDDHHLLLAVGDASGKGVSACFYSLGVRSMLRTYGQHYDDVGKILTETNNLFLRDVGDTGMFVTLFFASFDIKTQTLSYYSCGHNPPFLRKKDGSVQTLNHGGVALGFLKVDEIVPHTVRMESGDTLLLYSDGVTEAQNTAQEFFGEERLIHFLRDLGGRPLSEVAKRLQLELEEFGGTAPQHDDITALMMRVI